MAAAVIASEYSDLKSDGMSSSGKIHRSHSCEQVAKKKMDVAETMARLKLAGKSEYWWVSEKEIKFKSEKPKFGKLCRIQKAEWRSLTIAVKTLKEPIRHATDEIEELLREIAIWKTLRHPNIVMFLGASSRPDMGLMLLMEYMPSGSLQQYLTTRLKINARESWKIALDISSAMAFLHSCSPPVIHGDLQPENILFNSFGDAKIGDFGLSKYVRATPPSSGSAQKHVRYLAPEILLWMSVSLKSDVYAFGMILLDLFTKGPKHSDYLKVAKGSAKIPVDDCKNSYAKEVVLKCIEADIKKRASFVDIVNDIEVFNNREKCTIV